MQQKLINYFEIYRCPQISKCRPSLKICIRPNFDNFCEKNNIVTFLQLICPNFMQNRKKIFLWNNITQNTKNIFRPWSRKIFFVENHFFILWLTHWNATNSGGCCFYLNVSWLLALAQRNQQTHKHFQKHSPPAWRGQLIFWEFGPPGLTNTRLANVM